MLNIVKRLLTIGNILNWMFGIIVLVILILNYSMPEILAGPLLEKFNDADVVASIQFSLSAVMVLTLFWVPVIHIIFRKLIDMTDDFSMGIGFSVENAIRLRHVAIALLISNIIDLFFGWIAITVSHNTGEYFAWAPSFIAWFSVILVFALAEIFKQGAAMRDDLEGTI